MRITKYLRVVGLLVVVTLGAAACGGPAKSNGGLNLPPPKGGLVLFSYKTTLGEVVGDAFGGIVYADKNESKSKIECTGNCALTWRPWVTNGAAVHPQKGSKVQSSLIGTIKRPDGDVQMTYGGHPLYLYAHQANGLRPNAQGAGAVWYVVGTNGKLIT